jgi:hypothetical protein
VPFIWVSEPVAAGFFGFHVPSAKRPSAIVALDEHGRLVARVTPPPLHRFRVRIAPGVRRRPRELPPASAQHPTPPLQQASASGVSVVVGANGAVQLTAHDVPAEVRRLLTGSVSFSCFRFTREFGILGARGYGVEGAFAASVGFRLFGVGRPLDGCEVTSERGHRWPEALGAHAPVELPFTAKGRAYFTDRAAARDLALFVRSRRMQQIRRERGAQLLRDVHAAYGTALAHSRIRFALTANGITFSERSATGKRFEVVVANRRIRRSNVEPYALVF